MLWSDKKQIQQAEKIFVLNQQIDLLDIHENLDELNKFWLIEIHFLVESIKYFVWLTKHFVGSTKLISLIFKVCKASRTLTS